MSDTLFIQLLDLAVGVVLVCGFVVLWRRSVVAIVRTIAIQSAGLAAVALLLGLHDHDAEPIVVAALVLALKGVVIPRALLRVVRNGDDTRETESVVNVPASLLAAAGLTLLAYSATRDLVALDPAPEAKAIPIGMAVTLIGFVLLATRRKAVTQIVGFVVVDNGITLVAFLATSGVPFVVELGVALDVLLAVLILQVLAARMRTKFGAMDLNELQELRD
jgi:hydrogenase-4 component E